MAAAALAQSARRMSSAGRLFLGLDSSTQGIKATLVDDSLRVVQSAAINYQKEFPHYGIVNGMHSKPGNAVTQPTLMYVEALDALLTQLRKDGAPLDRVAAVSGSGQQHGSAYFRSGARATLQGLSAAAGPLKSQLASAFRLADSPIWMDSSTRAECAALEAAAGGADKVAAVTGSRAYERFTGNQIAKIARTDPAAYAETERISLISSLMASVLLGDYAPIDTSDGSGMNLLDIRSKAWSPAMAAALPLTAEQRAGLVQRLGAAPVPGHTVLGRVSRYFSEAYGFAPGCSVVAWSGDNPCSVAGLGLRSPGDVAVSLGTSDTMFGITAAPAPGLEGHLFVNPVDPGSYMGMLCYKNGSLARERVRDAVAGGSWPAFNALLAAGGEAGAGNGGHVGFFLYEPEITPGVHRAGVRRFGPGGARLEGAFPSPAHEARAVVEGQFLSMRVHGEAVGVTAPSRIIATGGASGNAGITQVLADVFGAPVFVAASTDSASLGAAFRAAHGHACAAAGAFVPFERVLAAGAAAGGGVALKLAASPRPAATAAYTALLPAYKAAEAQVIAEQ